MSLDKQHILDELDRITASEGFRSKPVMTKLLAYLVTETLEGRSDHIKGYSIGVDVFGQSGDFDPNSSALVRNNAVRLRSLLNTYYLGEGKNNPLVIEVPKGNYVPRFDNNHTDPDAPGPRDSGTAHTSTGSGRDRPPAIAVLPFTNLTRDPESDYLAAGFWQTLADAITKFELRVISIAHLIETNERRPGFADRAREIGLDFWIEGEVASIGKRAKVSFRLMDTAEKSLLWGDNIKFNLETDDLFDIQDKIAGRIASLVGGEYGYINQYRYKQLLASKPHSANEQEALLKHYHCASTLTADSMQEFHRYLLQALEQEPDSALIHACAAGLYSNFWTFAMPGADEALAKLAYHAEKAFELNPNNQWVLGNLGQKCFLFDERDRFFMLFNSQKEWLANSPLRLGGWALNMCYLGEWERGLALIDQVYEANQEVPSWLRSPYSIYYYNQRDYEKALKEAKQIQVPGLFWGPALRAACLGQLGRIEEAEREYTVLLQYRPDFVDVGRRIFQCYLKDADQLNHLLEGFAKFGKTFA